MSAFKELEFLPTGQLSYIWAKENGNWCVSTYAGDLEPFRFKEQGKPRQDTAVIISTVMYVIMEKDGAIYLLRVKSTGETSQIPIPPPPGGDVSSRIMITPWWGDVIVFTANQAFIYLGGKEWRLLTTLREQMQFPPADTKAEVWRINSGDVQTVEERVFGVRYYYPKNAGMLLLVMKSGKPPQWKEVLFGDGGDAATPAASEPRPEARPEPRPKPRPEARPKPRPEARPKARAMSPASAVPVEPRAVAAAPAAPDEAQAAPAEARTVSTKLCTRMNDCPYNARGECWFTHLPPPPATGKYVPPGRRGARQPERQPVLQPVLLPAPPSPVETPPPVPPAGSRARQYCYHKNNCIRWQRGECTYKHPMSYEAWLERNNHAKCFGGDKCTKIGCPYVH